MNLSTNLSAVCLHRVSENDENKMSPSNLGIVFGPTLLRPLVSTDIPMIALLETSYQAALVEFLITHHDRVFGLQQRSSTPPPPAPTAPLPDIPPRASCPLDGEVYSEHETSSRERPVSVEVSTAVRKRSNTDFRSGVVEAVAVSVGIHIGQSEFEPELFFLINLPLLC